MSLTPKQNYLNFLNHEEIEWTPVEIVDCSYIGFGSVPGTGRPFRIRNSI